MHNIILLTARPGYWNEHAKAMRQRGFEISLADSVRGAGELAYQNKTCLVLVDLDRKSVV